MIKSLFAHCTQCLRLTKNKIYLSPQFQPHQKYHRAYHSIINICKNQLTPKAVHASALLNSTMVLAACPSWAILSRKIERKKKRKKAQRTPRSNVPEERRWEVGGKEDGKASTECGLIFLFHQRNKVSKRGDGREGEDM